MKTIAEAIQYAHEKGIVHRDLKPHNVLVDASDQPRVTDFGLAKELESDSQLTGTGVVLGTPAYMAPEQAAAQHDQVGPASDIWSLGAILYEALTGRPPFQGNTTLDTLLQVLEADPPPPRSLDSGIPRNLEIICLKCLSKKPAARYATAAELAQDLHNYLVGEPILAKPPSLSERGFRWARSRPILALTYAACLAFYGLHLVGMLLLRLPREQGFFHWFLTILFAGVAGVRTLTQRLLDSDAGPCWGSMAMRS